MSAALRRSRAALVCAAWALAISGCAASVPLPRTGDHKGDTPVIVSYPPPPPQVEVVPPAPADLRDAVWVSGQWLWRGRRWEWDPGRWEKPEEGATYAPAAIVYLRDKQIGWLPGKWRERAPR